MHSRVTNSNIGRANFVLSVRRPFCIVQGGGLQRPPHWPLKSPRASLGAFRPPKGPNFPGRVSLYIFPSIRFIKNHTPPITSCVPPSRWVDVKRQRRVCTDSEEAEATVSPQVSVETAAPSLHRHCGNGGHAESAGWRGNGSTEFATTLRQRGGWGGKKGRARANWRATRTQTFIKQTCTSWCGRQVI